jgi:hypothetical protein
VVIYLLIIFQHLVFLTGIFYLIKKSNFYFVLFSYKVSSDTIQFVYTPIRIYYRLTRFIYGKDFKPFSEIEEGLHPIPEFYAKHQAFLRFLLLESPRFILPTLFIAIIIHYFNKQKFT